MAYTPKAPKKFEEDVGLKQLQKKENRTFLKVMLLFNAIGNHFKLKKNMTLDEMRGLANKCETGTFEELKQIWKEYMGFDWKGTE